MDKASTPQPTSGSYTIVRSLKDAQNELYANDYRPTSVVRNGE
jgi:hypothetical protein